MNPLPSDDETARLQIMGALNDRGRLTNAEVRAMTRLPAHRVYRLFRRMKEEGLVGMRGAGRGTEITRGVRTKQAGNSK